MSGSLDDLPLETTQFMRRVAICNELPYADLPFDNFEFDDLPFDDLPFDDLLFDNSTLYHLKNYICIYSFLADVPTSYHTNIFVFMVILQMYCRKKYRLKIEEA
jgi:hypothetical protein